MKFVLLTALTLAFVQNSAFAATKTLRISHMTGECTKFTSEEDRWPLYGDLQEEVIEIAIDNKAKAKLRRSIKGTILKNSELEILVESQDGRLDVFSFLKLRGEIVAGSQLLIDPAKAGTYGGETMCSKANEGMRTSSLIVEIL